MATKDVTIQYLILLCNSTGELERRTASNPSEIRRAVKDLADNAFLVGNTIRIVNLRAWAPAAHP